MTRWAEWALTRLVPSASERARLHGARSPRPLARRALYAFPGSLLAKAAVQLHRDPARLFRWALGHDRPELLKDAISRAHPDPRAARFSFSSDLDHATRLFWDPLTSPEARTAMVRRVLDHFVPEEDGGLEAPGEPNAGSGDPPCPEGREAEARQKWMAFFAPTSLPRRFPDLDIDHEAMEEQAAPELTSQDVERLLVFLEDLVCGWDAGSDAALKERQAWWVAALLVHDQGGAVDEEVLLQANAYCRSIFEREVQGMMAAFLLHHPSSGARLAAEGVRALPLDDQGARQTLRRIARDPRYTGDERVQQAVLESGDERAVHSVIRDLDWEPERHPWAFRILARHEPKLAVSLFRRSVLVRDSLTSELVPDDLLPLLSSAEPEVRAFAVEQTPKFAVGPEPSAPRPREAAPAGRGAEVRGKEEGQARCPPSGP